MATTQIAACQHHCRAEFSRAFASPRPSISRQHTTRQPNVTKRDFLSTTDLTRNELEDMLELAARAKGKRPGQVLAGKTLGLLFFDPSLRTRVSFDVAMGQLGGSCINLSRDDLYELEPTEQAVMDGRAEEHVMDAARTLSRYVDALGVRNVARTAPYMHSGRFATLGDVVEFYDELPGIPILGHRELTLQKREFTDAEKAELEAFLRSLDGAG
jgi:hypothetical protein